MGDHPLRQVVGFDLVGDGEVLQLRHQAPVAADDLLHQAGVGEMIEPALAAPGALLRKRRRDPQVSAPLRVSAAKYTDTIVISARMIM